MITMRFGASHNSIDVNGTVFDRNGMNDIQKRRLRKDVLDAFDDVSNETAKSKRADRRATNLRHARAA